jgi:hypothetical protein
MTAANNVRKRIEHGIADLSGMQLHDLPQTRDELHDIGKIVGREDVILLAKGATKTAFKNEPLLSSASCTWLSTPSPIPISGAISVVLGADPKAGKVGCCRCERLGGCG